MKTKFYILVAFFAMSITLNAKPVVHVIKSGGFLNLYNFVESQYIGFDVHNTTIHYYNLTCLNPGWIRCKLQYANYVSDTNPSDTDVASAEINSVNNAIEWADNEIETNQVASGTTTKHYAITLPNNTVLDVYVKLTWAPISGTSDYSIRAEVL